MKTLIDRAEEKIHEYLKIGIQIENLQEKIAFAIENNSDIDGFINKFNLLIDNQEIVIKIISRILDISYNDITELIYIFKNEKTISKYFK